MVNVGKPVNLTWMRWVIAGDCEMYPKTASPGYLYFACIGTSHRDMLAGVRPIIPGVW